MKSIITIIGALKETSKHTSLFMIGLILCTHDVYAYTYNRKRIYNSVYSYNRAVKSDGTLD